jgi:STE24 endopeptidase
VEEIGLEVLGMTWKKTEGRLRARRLLSIAGGLLLLCIVSTALYLDTQAAPESEPNTPQKPSPSASSDGKSVAPAEPRTKESTDSYRLPRDRYEQAVAFARTEYVLYFISAAWGILAILLVLHMGIVAKLRDLAERSSSNRFVQSLLFIPSLLLLLAVLRFPLSIYGHGLALRYKLSVQGWGSWLWDWCKGELLFVALGFLLVWILFWVIHWKPQTWWLYFWFALVPIALFIFFISPWFFDPLFNAFLPLQEKHPALVESIGKLTQRAGVPIPPERMFLMEASAKANEINAYVTGFGASKRVVIWDTSIQKTSPNELLYIVGHELGHYVLGHIWKGFLFFVVGSFFGLYLAFRLLRWILARWGGAWGIRGQEDWAVLAVLLLIMNVLEFVGTPIGNGFSRMQEHEADVYGLEVIHGLIPQSGEVAAGAFQVLGDVDLADPNPSKFITFWLYSHPPLGDRLSFAHGYDPWSKGEQPLFVK